MDATLSLSWDAHQNNICRGLSLLQQRGEFVDMTLAADGHHVRVHQMVLSLASSYIKDLISTAQCPHPIIFLNNIKYEILSAILEYVYTGETHVRKEILPDLISAGKALHIKGLHEMEDLNTATVNNVPSDDTKIYKICNFEMEDESKLEEEHTPSRNFVNCDDEQTMEVGDTTIHDTNVSDTEELYVTRSQIKNLAAIKNKPSIKTQYTISNQGNLQVIVNRYIYTLKYVQKNLNKYWRCSDYSYKKCPANLYTDEKNQVIKRKGTHNHPFHDQKIMKKGRMGLIFGAYSEAEDIVRSKKAGGAEDDVDTYSKSEVTHLD